MVTDASDSPVRPESLGPLLRCRIQRCPSVPWLRLLFRCSGSSDSDSCSPTHRLVDGFSNPWKLKKTVIVPRSRYCTSRLVYQSVRFGIETSRYGWYKFQSVSVLRKSVSWEGASSLKLVAGSDPCRQDWTFVYIQHWSLNSSGWWQGQVRSKPGTSMMAFCSRCSSDFSFIEGPIQWEAFRFKCRWVGFCSGELWSLWAVVWTGVVDGCS